MTASGPVRKRRSSEGLRERLLEAAVVEFATHGFDGASTRAIAERADAHQPQINYHFSSKEELWRACAAHLLAELDAVMAGIDTATTRSTVEGYIRALVRFIARRPEIGAVLVREGTEDTPRLRWLVEEHLAARFRRAQQLWRAARAEGVAAPVPDELFLHILIGAVSLPYTNAPEARLLGIDTADPALVEAHADALVAILLPRAAPTAGGER